MREGLSALFEHFGELLVWLLVSNWNSPEWLSAVVFVLGTVLIGVLAGHWVHGRHRAEHERREAERSSRRPPGEAGTRDPGS